MLNKQLKELSFYLQNECSVLCIDSSMILYYTTLFILISYLPGFAVDFFVGDLHCSLWDDGGLECA